MRVRTSYLLETSDFTFDISHWDVIKPLCKKLGLRIQKDQLSSESNPRYFISRGIDILPKTEIGILLNMYKPRSNFSDYMSKRFTFIIYLENTNTNDRTTMFA